MRGEVNIETQKILLDTIQLKFEQIKPRGKKRIPAPRIPWIPMDPDGCYWILVDSGIRFFPLDFLLHIDIFLFSFDIYTEFFIFRIKSKQKSVSI
jgi:hypothetical protein